MDHLGIPGTRVLPDPVLGLEDENLAPRKGKLPRNGQAHNTSTDDYAVDSICHEGNPSEGKGNGTC